MISYKPFFNMIDEKKITQYQLIKNYGFSTSLLDKLRHNKGLRLTTIDDICLKMHCSIEDVVEIVDENNTL